MGLSLIKAPDCMLNVMEVSLRDSDKIIHYSVSSSVMSPAAGIQLYSGGSVQVPVMKCNAT